MFVYVFIVVFSFIIKNLRRLDKKAVVVRSQQTSTIQTEDRSLLDVVTSLGKQRGTLLYMLQESGAGHIDGWPGWVREKVLATRPLTS